MTLWVLLALAAGAVWLWHLYWHPFSPCRRCGGNGRNHGSTRKRFGDCRRCGGNGRRTRLGARTLHHALRARKR